MDNYSKKDENGRFGAFTRDENMNTPPAVIPYYAHEAEIMRMEKHARRLWVLVIILIFAMLATNAAWLWYINQYDFEEYEYQQDGEGINIIGEGNGVNTNGTRFTRAQAEEEEWECKGEGDEET